jgi:hypothetical protein
MAFFTRVERWRSPGTQILVCNNKVQNDEAQLKDGSKSHRYDRANKESLVVHGVGVVLLLAKGWFSQVGQRHRGSYQGRYANKELAGKSRPRGFEAHGYFCWYYLSDAKHANY